MATDIRDANGVALTQQEAEAVIELWAKKQAETEALRSRLTVQDMAEAMSIPPGEVEQMLTAVRLQQSAPPTLKVDPKVRPVNKLLIGIAGVAWLLLLIAACFTAYGAGRKSAFVDTPPPAFAPPAPETTVDVSTMSPPAAESTGLEISQMGSLFERNVTVTFGDAIVKGKVSRQGRPIMTSRPLLDLVHTASPIPSANDDSEMSNLTIVQTLRASQNPPDGSFEFRTMVIQLPNGEKISSTIPVSNTQNPRVVTLVYEEQLSRLKILASKVEQKLAP